MKIVFFDQLGYYASVVAASYEVGLICEDSKAGEIARLGQFADHQDMSVGTLSYVGTNLQGQEIYTLGTGRYGKLISISAQDLFKIIAVPEEIKIIDVSVFNSPLIKIAAYLRQNKLLRNIVVLLAAQLLKKQMSQIVRKVNNEMRASR